MTTTITVETHEWPVAVHTDDHHNFDTPTKRGWSNSTTTEFVPPHTKRQFHITDTRSVNFRELSKDATDLNYGCDSVGDVPISGSRMNSSIISAPVAATGDVTQAPADTIAHVPV